MFPDSLFRRSRSSGALRHSWLSILLRGRRRRLRSQRREQRPQTAVELLEYRTLLEATAGLPLDFGDAPESYATLLIDDGPRHALGGPVLGIVVDSEMDGRPSSESDGDDNGPTESSPDEDGVKFPALVAQGTVGIIEVTSSPGGGVLDHFYDFDGSGTFGNNSNEVFTTLLRGGTQRLPIPIPVGAKPGVTTARFRISTLGGLSPTGAAADGEVEDYHFEITGNGPPNVSISGPSGTATDANAPEFSWDVTDADGNLASVNVTVTQNGSVLRSFTDASGRLALNDFGLGTFAISVSAQDARAAATTKSRTVIVTDDDTVPPTVLINGPTEVEYEGLPQQFTWTATDVSGIASAAVSIRKNGSEVFSSSAADGAFSLDEAGAGTFELTVIVTDADADRPGDSLTVGVARRVAVVAEPFDFGDAPSSYGVSLSAGARHLVAGPRLGAGVDAEPNGMASADAAADDRQGSVDDEDGVRFLSPFLQGTVVHVEVTTSTGGGVLDHFYDFDGDGRFGNAPAEIFRTTLSGGTQFVSVALPANAKVGSSFARFRISSTGGLGPNGRADDGEVEDYQIEIVANALPSSTPGGASGSGTSGSSGSSPQNTDPPVAPILFDFSDAPASYATSGEQAARHLVQGPFLGAIVDTEALPNASADALGDDQTPSSSDDEDGIRFLNAAIRGTVAILEVTSSSGGGVLDHFYDFDSNGTFGNRTNETFTTRLTGGTQIIAVAIPTDAKVGATFARFRLSTAGGLGPAGAADNGEIEDYRFEITSNDRPNVVVGGTSGTSTTDVDQHFTWSVVDPDGDSTVVVVGVTRDGSQIFSENDGSGRFDFNSFGAGSFVLTVTAQDRHGAMATASRLATVVNPPPATPTSPTPTNPTPTNPTPTNPTPTNPTPTTPTPTTPTPTNPTPTTPTPTTPTPTTPTPTNPTPTNPTPTNPTPTNPTPTNPTPTNPTPTNPTPTNPTPTNPTPTNPTPTNPTPTNPTPTNPTPTNPTPTNPTPTNPTPTNPTPTNPTPTNPTPTNPTPTNPTPTNPTPTTPTPTNPTPTTPTPTTPTPTTPTPTNPTPTNPTPTNPTPTNPTPTNPTPTNPTPTNPTPTNPTPTTPTPTTPTPTTPTPTTPTPTNPTPTTPTSTTPTPTNPTPTNPTPTNPTPTNPTPTNPTPTTPTPTVPTPTTPTPTEPQQGSGTPSAPQSEVDFGDAPVSYGSAGASAVRHRIAGPFLGMVVDAESAGRASTGATADDVDGASDDEDGIRFRTRFEPGQVARLEVTSANGGGVLNHFYDFDGDGTFGNQPSESFSTHLTAGTQIVSVLVPVTATAGMSFARFRISSAGNLGPTGEAGDGEVEDYRIEILPLDGGPIVLGGSIGSETDDLDQHFRWNAIDPSNTLRSVNVAILKDGVRVGPSNASLRGGSFDLNSYGVGTFKITVSAVDLRKKSTLSDSRTVQVTAAPAAATGTNSGGAASQTTSTTSGNNGTNGTSTTQTTAPPTTSVPTTPASTGSASGRSGVVLSGSTGSESTAQDQHFAWQFNDPSNSLRNLSVAVFKNGVRIGPQSTAVRSGRFDLNPFGVGTFTIEASAVDARMKRNLSERRSVTVIEQVPSPEIAVGGSSGLPATNETPPLTWSGDSPNGILVTEPQFVAVLERGDGFAVALSGAFGTRTATASGAVDVVLRFVDGFAIVEINGVADQSLGSIAANEVASIVLYGGSENDRIDLSRVTLVAFPKLTSVVVLGGLGNDTLTGSDVADELSGEDGDDLLNGLNGDDTLIGGQGNDKLLGSSGRDLVFGGDGDDLVAGQGGSGDSLVGGVGNDTLDGGIGDDVLFESATGVTTLSDTSLIGRDRDVLVGVERAYLEGSDVQDVIDVRGFSGATTLNGGGGDDTLLGGPANDVLLGSSGADLLDGGGGNDIASGQGGSRDSLIAGDGNDSLDGGAGYDLLFASGNLNFTIDDARLTATGISTLKGIEGASLTAGLGHNRLDASNFSGDTTLNGLDGDDTLLGGKGNDSLLGGAGRDLINGGAGNDLLFGQGSSNDTLTGGPGNDLLDGGAGTDLVDETASTSLTLTPTKLTGLGTDQLVAVETARLSGTNDGNSPIGNVTFDAGTFLGSVTLIGGAGDDVLIGGLNDDALYGGGGNDFLRGAAGHDFMNGGDGRDSLLGLSGNDSLLGSGGHDVLFGGSDNDQLSGDAGRDLLIGDLGADSLRGGDDDDLLIGDVLEFGRDFDALNAVMSVWTNGSNYGVRVAALEDANFLYFLKSAAQVTDRASVYDDFVMDTLVGTSGVDWFFRPGVPSAAGANDVHDRDPSERVSTSDFGSSPPGFLPADMRRPGYLQSLRDPALGALVTRITGDPGTTFNAAFNLGGELAQSWGGVVRNRYVSDSAWNVDGSLIQVHSYDPALPYNLVLDGGSYEPKYVVSIPSANWLWSRDPARPTIQYAFISESTDPPGQKDDLILEYDVTTGAVLRTIELPFHKFPPGKTDIAFVNGRQYVALLGRDKTDTNAGIQVYVVDLGQSAGSSPVIAQFRLAGPDCGLLDPQACTSLNVNSLRYSPDGRRILVGYDGVAGLDRSWRLLDVDLSAGRITPHRQPVLSPQSFLSTGATEQGHFAVNWSHPVFALSGNGQDVYVVGSAGNFAGRDVPEVATFHGTVGALLAYNTTTKAYKSLNDPNTSVRVDHVTATNHLRPGYVFAVYSHDPGSDANKRGTITAINLDDPAGTNGEIPLVQHRSNAANDCYHCQPHPTISPDGSKLLFSSTWGATQGAVSSYVVDLNLP